MMCQSYGMYRQINSNNPNDRVIKNKLTSRPKKKGIDVIDLSTNQYATPNEQTVNPNKGLK